MPAPPQDARKRRAAAPADNGRHAARQTWPATTRRLLAVRTIRSIGQGALIVTFALYLKALGWKGGSIGVLLTAGGLLNSGLSILVGAISDRTGARPFLLVYEAVICAAGAAALFSSSHVLLIAASIFGGFGRGQNGAAGPFSPAEGAWLADGVPPEERGELYSLNAALGFFGMAVGAILPMLMPLWRHAFSGAAAYRPLFGVTMLGAMVSWLILVRTPGGTPRRASRGSSESAGRAGAIGKRTSERPNPHKRSTAAAAGQPERAWIRPLVLLVMINAFNGVAIGITSPLISYWFADKFHAGPSQIGETFLVTFLLTGAASLATGRLTRTWGIIRSVVSGRLAGLMLLAVLPLAPTYGLASAVFVLRSAFNRGTAGARQALAVALVPEERRGLGISLNAASMQLPSAVGPTIAGYLYQAGVLALPFYLAAGLQFIYLVLYLRLFRQFEPEPASPLPEAGSAGSEGNPT